MNVSFVPSISIHRSIILIFIVKKVCLSIFFRPAIFDFHFCENPRFRDEFQTLHYPNSSGLTTETSNFYSPHCCTSVTSPTPTSHRNVGLYCCMLVTDASSLSFHTVQYWQQILHAFTVHVVFPAYTVVNEREMLQAM